MIIDGFYFNLTNITFYVELLQCILLLHFNAVVYLTQNVSIKANIMFLICYHNYPV